MIYDQAMTMLVHCFLFEGIACGVFGLRMLSWWRLYCSYKEHINVVGLFFLFFFFFLGGCVHS
jgi:hypothetical protein